MIDLTRYVGIPYLPGGRSFDGVDCYGMVWLFHREELGIALPSYDCHPDMEEMAEISRILHGIEDGSGAWKEVPRKEARLGDVVDLSLNRYFHVGIYVPNGRMLHAMLNTASVIEKLNGLKWRTRIRGCFRRV